MELPMQAGSARPRRGFTLVEMMVTIVIMTIIISMAVPQLSKAIVRSKESVLRNNLTTIRQTLDNYCYDKGKCPLALSDLVNEGYLRSIPTDPMNNYSTNWNTVMEDPTNSTDPQEPGIWDVHSASDKTSPLEGTAYSSW